MNQYTRPKDKDPLVKILVEKVVQISGDEHAVDLICQANLPCEWTENFRKAIVPYAKGIGREKAVRTPNLIHRISRTGDPDAVPLLRQWLKEEKGEKESLELAKALGGLPGTEPVLRELLSDPRPDVAEWARIKLRQ
jgi:hypothetical protein